MRTTVAMVGVTHAGWYDWLCRGMLIGPPQGIPGSTYGAGRGVGRADAGIDSGEGTSRAQGRGTASGRFEDGEASSESD